jgi:GT2 family glycosyltransferase
MLVSVVIPTYQGRGSIGLTLDALGRQTIPHDDYEVVVSIDGSTDGTQQLLAALSLPYALRVVRDERNRGRATACNRGITTARGDLVVILDDDMEPIPRFLDAHRQRHMGAPRRGVLGAVPIAYDALSSAALRYVGPKFNRHLQKLASPGVGIHCRDFYSGNFSARREVLLEAGLFDESFTVYGNEDVELGLRLVNRGVELMYAPEAVAMQHYDKSIDGLAADEVAKGRSAVLLATKHPECLPFLKLATYREGSAKRRMVRRALLFMTQVFPPTRMLVVRLLNGLELLEPQVLDRYFPLVLDYFFWAGASAALRENDPAAAQLKALIEERG